MASAAHTGFRLQADGVPFNSDPGRQRELAKVKEGSRKESFNVLQAFLLKGNVHKELACVKYFFLIFFLTLCIHLYYFYVREQYLQCLEIKQSNLN